MRVVITGASRGLGLELARQHLARGDRVLATHRSERPPPALLALAGPGLSLARLDVSRPESIDRAARERREPAAATQSAEETVAGMLRVADALTPDRSGAFLDWRGREVPW